MRLLVTGADGFLASRICGVFRDKGWKEVYGLNHRELDFTSAEQVKSCFKQIRPEAVIHCGAVSDIGACERNPSLSESVNVRGTETIAAECGRGGAKLIFCSSDQIYAGSGTETPHREEETVSPPHLYGRQKLEAEALVGRYCPDGVSLRLSWMYAVSYREAAEHSNFIRNIAEAVKTGSTLAFPVFDYRSITDVMDVAENMEKALLLPGGVYNFGSANSFSTYETASWFLAGFPRASCLLRKNEDAFRGHPRNLRMDCGKLNRFGIFFPDTVSKLLEYKEAGVLDRIFGGR